MVKVLANPIFLSFKSSFRKSQLENIRSLIFLCLTPIIRGQSWRLYTRIIEIVCRRKNQNLKIWILSGQHLFVIDNILNIVNLCEIKTKANPFLQFGVTSSSSLWVISKYSDSYGNKTCEFQVVFWFSKLSSFFLDHIMTLFKSNKMFE